MKNYKLKAMLLLAVLLSSVSVFAENLLLNDVYYALNDDGTAGVSGAKDGIIAAVIPEKITNEGQDYIVTTIWGRAFEDCSSLTSITIPNSVTNIGYCAFYGCISLENISFGANLKLIGKDAFSGCKAVKQIVANASVPPTCSSGALDDINKETCILQVPTENVDVYKATMPWNEFFKIGSIETGIKGSAFDGVTETERFIIGGTLLYAPQKGINIVRMSD